jgi:Glycosyl hydrolase catalytic core
MVRSRGIVTGLPGSARSTILTVRRLIAITICLATVSGAAAAAPRSPKRGVASAHYLSTDARALAPLHAAWAYDWSWRAPLAVPGLEWVPMIWGPGSITPASIAALTAQRRSGRAGYLLGFNEPDSGSQANISPQRAAELWPRLEATGLSLGSPAPAVPDDGWLARFMAIARARRLRVDFIALHFYQDFTDPHAVDELRAELSSIHRRYGKPLWITEIGALDIRAWGEHMDHAPTPALASAYLRRLLPMLDGLSFVERYAWFTDLCSPEHGCPASALFDRRGGLSPRGQIYARASTLRR